MKWRLPMAVALGLLLPVPLLLLVGGALGWGGQGPRDDALSPMLSWEQRQRLLTFGRPCRDSNECEAPLACLQDSRRIAEPRCVASECVTDLQCEEGFACQVMTSLGKGRHVRVCVVAAGLREEGQVCSPLPRTREVACEEGLICRGWCGRPCRREEPASCPEGFYCDTGPQGTSCLPTCEGRACPAGQECARFESGPSTCAVVRGQNCQRTPCPHGAQCRTTYSPQKPGEVKMECVVPCDEKAPACSAGALCHNGVCRQACEPGSPDACASGQACTYHPFEKRWLCQLT